MTELSRLVHQNFGEVEALLSEVHDIASPKRMAFASRLKNFHRLGFPHGFKAGRGKVNSYSPYKFTLLAIAVEMTQLGLPPERIVRILSKNWFPTDRAILEAAKAVKEDSGLLFREDGRLISEADSIFIYFDPAGLATLTNCDPTFAPDLDEASDTYFYGAYSIIKDDLSHWTQRRSNRIAMINITGLIAEILYVMFPSSDPGSPIRNAFCDSLISDASDILEMQERQWAYGDYVYKMLGFYGVLHDPVDAALYFSDHEKFDETVESVAVATMLPHTRAREILLELQDDLRRYHGSNS